MVRALAQGRSPQHGIGVDDITAHIVGAWGELALAKQTGRYWAGDLGRPDRGAPDVGPFHVRTGTARDCRLILRDPDHDDGVFVLVVPAGLPRFRVVGCCYGWEGKDPAYLFGPNGRPGAYFVPVEVLRPLPDLENKPEEP
jgi:hypothetical protein